MGQREIRDRPTADSRSSASCVRQRRVDTVAGPRPADRGGGRSGRDAVDRLVQAGLPQQRAARMDDERTRVGEVARRHLFARQTIGDAVALLHRAAVQHVEAQRRDLGRPACACGVGASHRIPNAVDSARRKRRSEKLEIENWKSGICFRMTGPNSHEFLNSQFLIPNSSFLTARAPTAPRALGGLASGAGTGSPRSASA